MHGDMERDDCPTSTQANIEFSTKLENSGTIANQSFSYNDAGGQGLRDSWAFCLFQM